MMPCLMELAAYWHHKILFLAYFFPIIVVAVSLDDQADKKKMPGSSRKCERVNFRLKWASLGLDVK